MLTQDALKEASAKTSLTPGQIQGIIALVLQLIHLLFPAVPA